MDLLRVSDALPAVAGRCNTLGAEVGAGVPPVSGLSGQPSSAAMYAGHTGVAAAAAPMTARMRATGAAITVAWAGYEDNETHAVAELRAVTDRVM
ncbi:MAG: hypothetical protein ABI307_13120 [Mycobacterium sp.]